MRKLLSDFHDLPIENTQKIKQPSTSRKIVFDFHDIWRNTEKSSTEKTLKFSL
jgi:hypothetical protein